MRALSAPYCGLAFASTVDRSRTRSRRRFAHSLQQFLEDDCVIVRFVLRGEEQSQPSSFVDQFVELHQRVLGFRLRQLFQIFLAEILPALRSGMKPAAQFVGRRQIAQPFVNCRIGFCDSTGPEPIDEHAHSIAAGRRFVNAFKDNSHEQGFRL